MSISANELAETTLVDREAEDFFVTTLEGARRWYELSVRWLEQRRENNRRVFEARRDGILASSHHRLQKIRAYQEFTRVIEQK